MDKESAWKRFEKSGRIKDYLLYKDKRGVCAGIDQDDEHDIYPGVSHENICYGYDYSRNKFWGKR